MKYTHHILRLSVGIAAFFIVATHVFAQDAERTYTPLSGIPGIAEGQVNLLSYINALITLTITLAAIFSVVMLTLIGFQFVTGDAAGPSRKVLKDKLTAVLLGVLLIASTYIILNTINPNLVNIDALRGLENTTDIGDAVDEIDNSEPKGTKKGLAGSCIDINMNDRASLLRNEADDYLNDECEKLGGFIVRIEQGESCTINPLIGEDVPGFRYIHTCY